MSEESDIEDHVAFEEDNGSLGEYDSEDSNSHHFDSEESGSEDAGGLLDVEAIESDGESDGESEDTDDDSSDAPTQQSSFQLFKLLPTELQDAIWAAFDPYLKAKIRIFKVTVPESSMVWESAFLEQQTGPARAMLSVDRKTRMLARESYPDTFPLRGGLGRIPYRKATDIIFLDGAHYNELDNLIPALEFPDHVAFSALASNLVDAYWGPRHLRYTKPPRTLYQCFDPVDFRNLQLDWCARESTHSFYLEQTEDFSGTIETMYCWPFVEYPTRPATAYASPRVLESDEGLVVWPIVDFTGEDSIRRFLKIQAAVDAGVEVEDSDESYDWDSITEDEYESEGIDDTAIDSEDLSDEDDLVVQSGPDEEGSVSTFGGFSPIQNPELSLGDEVGVGNFSSLEPESPNRDGGESEHAASDEESVHNMSRRTKRRIVSSDDEGNAEDDSNAEAKMPSRPAKRSRVVLSDSEEDDDEGGDNTIENGNGAADGSEEGDSSDQTLDVSQDDDSEDEEPVKAKPMSLFKRINQQYEKGPKPMASCGSSDDGASMGDEQDGGMEFQDDEADDADELLKNAGSLDAYDEDSVDDEDER